MAVWLKTNLSPGVLIEFPFELEKLEITSYNQYIQRDFKKINIQRNKSTFEMEGAMPASQ
jgi:hypothetical protein